MIGALVLGLAAGLVSGLLGVGGGILFVPALTLFLALTQVRAEATSLLAIIPVALIGGWQQWRYGNVAATDAATVSLLSLGGVSLGVVLANTLPERLLRYGFAAFAIVLAGQVARRATRQR